MGLFNNDTSNTPVPGGNLTKPVLIALGALLVGRMFSGKDQPDKPTDNSGVDDKIEDSTASSVSGVGGLLTGVLGSILGSAASGLGKTDNDGQSNSHASANGANDDAVGGGLGGLLNQLTQAGHEEKVKSWLGNGENAAITPDQLGDAIGSNTVSEISEQAGVSKQQLLDELSQALPGIIDQLTVNGQVPDLQQLLKLLGRKD